jgi:hypothetical protein
MGTHDRELSFASEDGRVLLKSYHTSDADGPISPKIVGAAHTYETRNTGHAMSRASAVAIAQAYFDDGPFLEDLGRRIAIPRVPDHSFSLRHIY